MTNFWTCLIFFTHTSYLWLQSTVESHSRAIQYPVWWCVNYKCSISQSFQLKNELIQLTIMVLKTEHFKLPHLEMAHSQMGCLSTTASELRLEYESIWYDTLELNCQMRYGADSHRKSNNWCIKCTNVGLYANIGGLG